MKTEHLSGWLLSEVLVALAIIAILAPAVADLATAILDAIGGEANAPSGICETAPSEERPFVDGDQR